MRNKYCPKDYNSINSNDSQNYRIKLWHYVKRGIIITLVVIASYALYIWLIQYELFTNLSQGGQFGDSFGGFTALFSALALSALLVSIYIQIKELNDTKHELSKSERALSGQLENMQVASQIDAIHRYRQTLKGIELRKHAYVLDQIIHQITLAIIDENKYSPIIKPKLAITRNKEFGSDGLDFDLYNFGASAFLQRVETEGQVEIMSMPSQLKRNSAVQFFNEQHPNFLIKLHDTECAIKIYGYSATFESVELKITLNLKKEYETINVHHQVDIINPKRKLSEI